MAAKIPYYLTLLAVLESLSSYNLRYRYVYLSIYVVYNFHNESVAQPRRKKLYTNVIIQVISFVF